MDEVPAHVAAAWGLRERPSRGPRPALTLDRIVTAAVAVADAEGLAGLSMSRVAAELGTGAMSLYRYVASKDELVALMVDAAGGLPPAAPPDEDWRTALTRWAWGYLGVLRAHPWTLRIPITEPPCLPNQLAWMENGLRAMAGTGLRPPQKMSVLLLLSGFVRNEATLSADIGGGDLDPQEMMAGYGNLLARVLTPERFPALTEVLESGVFHKPDHPDDEFKFGLARILDGVEVLVRSL